MGFLGSKLGAALAEVRESLDLMRRSIRELKDERAKVYAAPVPKEDALAALDRVMTEMAAAFRADGLNVATLTRRDRDASDFRLVRRFGLGEDLGDRLATGALWTLFGAAVRLALVKELDAWYAAATLAPMSDAERDAALMHLNHEIASREAHAEELAATLEQAAAAARA